MSQSATLAPPTAWRFTRGEVAAAMILVLVLAALAPITVAAFGADPLTALVNGGGVSWVVWLALGLAVRLALKAPPQPATRGDLAGGAVCLAVVLLPSHALINLAATGLALRYALSPKASKELRGAGIILFAVFVAIFWSSNIFPMFAGQLARFDAWWVGLATGNPAQGNVINFQDGEGSFLLAGPCTSVSNASLALLLWISISRSARPQGSRRDWLTALGVLASVMAVNVARLALMSRNLEAFDVLHVSAAVATVVTATGLAWALWDVRRELLA